VQDFTVHNLSTGTEIDAHLHARATLRPDDLSLQPPRNARFIEDLQAISRPIDVQMKTLAALLTFDVQKEPIPHNGGVRCGATAK
jgi:hypothetical protein